MRTSKELILSSKVFTKENRKKSWFETILTLCLIVICLVLSFWFSNVFLRLFCSVLTGLFYVRMFVIYHDYQHHAILQKSVIASFIMKTVGIYLLTPQNIWKRSHDHHHTHNSKLSGNGIGSYPTISKEMFLKLSPAKQKLYLINRHPLTVILGYFTLFIYWLNVKSFSQSPKKHLDSLLSLVIHFGLSISVFYFLGATSYWISWFLPFFLAFGIGSYLFYSQHNFPNAKFKENQDWKYEVAALTSTSFMKMNPIMNWITGNIGYHHVHHLNSRIPFYRLKEVMEKMPELQDVTETSWNPIEMYRCLSLKLWDAQNNKMIRLKDL
jgi:omega-6 fatty acid desaturase (delta-12 desaturase)